MKRMFRRDGQWTQAAQDLARETGQLLRERVKELAKTYDTMDVEHIVVHEAQMACVLARIDRQINSLRRKKKK